MSDMPLEVGICKFNDGTFDCYPDSVGIPPATEYILKSHHTAEVERLEARIKELEDALRKIKALYKCVPLADKAMYEIATKALGGK